MYFNVKGGKWKYFKLRKSLKRLKNTLKETLGLVIHAHRQILKIGIQ